MDIESKQLLVEVYSALQELNINGKRNISILYGAFIKLEMVMQKIMEVQTQTENQSEEK